MCGSEKKENEIFKTISSTCCINDMDMLIVCAHLQTIFPITDADHEVAVEDDGAAGTQIVQKAIHRQQIERRSKKSNS